ncbi:MAG: hypothetical protein KC502_06685 [Myxococcales bacterium]|nr:hypothetical protein [Myxococcales bacterium]
MDRRHFLTTLVTTAAAAACGPIEVVNPTLSKAQRREEGKIMGTVVYARRAGLLRHHMGPALRPWATNSTLTLARDKDKQPHDLVLNRDRMVERTMNRYFGTPTLGRMLRFSEAQTKITGSQAQFSFTTQIIDPTYAITLREEYELWLSELGWRILHCRRWPQTERKSGKTAHFGVIEWRHRDGLANEAKEKGQARAHIAHLLSGWRYDDAWRASQAATTDKTVSKAEQALRWALRGAVAVEMGYANEAIGAYKEALRLNPKVRMAAVKAAADARVAMGL